jgi:glycosyltransferase involved in cell wall biosynthesis
VSLMTESPTVSGILIFLNAKAFLREAIESVLAQTSHDWELLLVDDGSKDESTEVARLYAERYPSRIRYLTHEARRSRGKSSSRNLGINEARGEYVAFLDADDLWLPSKLAEQIDRISRYPEAVMLYGPTTYWHSWATANQHRDYRGVLGVPADTLYLPPFLLTRYLARSAIVPGLCSILARRNAVLKLGGFEESIQQLFEDQTLIAKLCLHGPVYVDSGCHDLYRQHPDSSSAQAVTVGLYHPWRPNVSHLAYLEWLAGYVARCFPQHERLRCALRRELWLEHHTFAGSAVGLGRVAAEIARRTLRRNDGAKPLQGL